MLQFAEPRVIGKPLSPVPASPPLQSPTPPEGRKQPRRRFGDRRNYRRAGERRLDGRQSAAGARQHVEHGIRPSDLVWRHCRVARSPNRSIPRRHLDIGAHTWKNGRHTDGICQTISQKTTRNVILLQTDLEEPVRAFSNEHRGPNSGPGESTVECAQSGWCIPVAEQECSLADRRSCERDKADTDQKSTFHKSLVIGCQIRYPCCPDRVP